jgi:iron complex transport system substrate-binding protein
MNRFNGWNESDIEDVKDIAPIFANSIFSRGYPWHEDYQYYTLYEAFGKLATVFQRQDRYEAFVDLHEEFQSELADAIPPESERPNVAFFWAGGDQPEKFLPYVMNEGTSFKQWNDLRVGDALTESDVQDFHSNRAAVDYETLLEIDPEILLLRGQEAKNKKEFQETTVSYFEDHNVASQLTAVQNSDVYRGGPLYQGPILNLILTERAAKQVYDVDQELFDRQLISDIVAGDV